MLNLAQEIAALEEIQRDIDRLKNLNARLAREQATLTVFTLARCESKCAGDDWTGYGAEPRRESWLRKQG